MNALFTFATHANFSNGVRVTPVADSLEANRLGRSTNDASTHDLFNSNISYHSVCILTTVVEISIVHVRLLAFRNKKHSKVQHVFF